MGAGGKGREPEKVQSCSGELYRERESMNKHMQREMIKHFIFLFFHPPTVSPDSN